MQKLECPSFFFTYNNGTFVTMAKMEISELFEWIVADDIAVQNEERAIVLGQNLPGKSKRTGGTKRLGFHREGDGDIEFFFILLKSGYHYFWSVVDRKNDICDTSLHYKIPVSLRNQSPGFHQMTRHLPTLAKFSIWCKIIGLLANSTSGLGKVSVRGRSRVPKPW